MSRGHTYVMCGTSPNSGSVSFTRIVGVALFYASSDVGLGKDVFVEMIDT